MFFQGQKVKYCMVAVTCEISKGWTENSQAVALAGVLRWRWSIDMQLQLDGEWDHGDDCYYILKDGEEGKFQKLSLQKSTWSDAYVR